MILFLATNLFVLEIIWFIIMENRYLMMSNYLRDKKETKKSTGRLLLSSLYYYLLMSFALYYFVLQQSKNSNDALIKGCLMGFIITSIHNKVTYSFLPTNSYKTLLLLDTLYGTFECGISSYVAFKYYKNTIN